MEKIVVKIEPDLLLKHLRTGVTNDSEPLADFEEKMDTFHNLPALTNGAPTPAGTSESSSECKIFKTPKKEVKEIPDHDSELNCVEIKEEIEEKYAPLDPVLFCESVLSSTNNQKAANVFKCSECAMEFPKNTNLQKHMRAAHMNKFPCSLCEKSYVDKARLHRHKVKVHNINDKETEESNSKIPATAKVPVAPEKLKCFKCDLSFTTDIRLKNHEYSAHPVKKEFKCSTCELKFSSENILQLHEKFTHPKKLDSDVKNVIKTESMSPPPTDILESDTSNKTVPVGHFGCPLCPQYFKTVRGVNIHSRSIHLDGGFKYRMLPENAEVQPLSPPSSPLPESSSSSFSDKERTVSNSSSSSANVVYPYKIRQEGNFRCPHCPSSFKNIMALCGHSRVHSDLYTSWNYHEKPGTFKCSKCDQTFKDISSLFRHEKQHGEKYLCQSCPGAFTTKRNLLRHKHMAHPRCQESTDAESHEGWPCDLCPAILKTYQARRVHRLTVHPEHTQFKCSKCDLHFSTHQRRLKHMKKHKKSEEIIRFTIKCYKCDLIFTTLLEKARHEDEFHSKTPVVSNKYKPAKKSFTKPFRTTAYIGNPGVVSCNICYKVFLSKYKLKYHKKMKHSESQKATEKPKKMHKNVTLSSGDGDLSRNIVTNSESTERIKPVEVSVNPEENPNDFEQKIFSGDGNLLTLSGHVETSEVISESVVIKPEEVLASLDNVKKEFISGQSEPEEMIIGF